MLKRIDLSLPSPLLPSADSISVIACKRAKFVSRLINPIIPDGNLFFVAVRISLSNRGKLDRDPGNGEEEKEEEGKEERKRWIERTALSLSLSPRAFIHPFENNETNFRWIVKIRGYYEKDFWYFSLSPFKFLFLIELPP